jgi:hypothetical protein
MPTRTCALPARHATTGATILNESPIRPSVHRWVPCRRVDERRMNASR